MDTTFLYANQGIVLGVLGQLTPEAEQCLESQPKRVTLTMGSTKLPIDVAGIQWVFALFKSCEQKGIDLKLHPDTLGRFIDTLRDNGLYDGNDGDDFIVRLVREVE